MKKYEKIKPLTKAQQVILTLFLDGDRRQSSDVFQNLVASGEKIALVTVKRGLAKMSRSGFLEVTGSGRSTGYAITVWGRFNTSVDAGKYCAEEPDKRSSGAGYRFDLLRYFERDPFQKEEHFALASATLGYRKKIAGISPVLREKEFQRFVIELSWKSSKIEGNTYTLLDTEKLLARGEKAPGRSQQETQMILNHKAAFNLIYGNIRQFNKLTPLNIREVHKILVKNLTVNTGWRNSAVGIAGSNYRPLDNRHQIEDAMNLFVKSVNKQKNPYARALFTLLGISYIQPFEDGNKRAGRLLANALLLANNLAPLSYRSVKEDEYKEATMVFYELNSIQPLKKIFMEQYKFAAENYSVKPA